MQHQPRTLFDFTKDAELSDWYILDDVVMGGRSDGHLTLTKEGMGLFSGHVSTENNGGFSSVRYKNKQLNISGYTVCKLRLRGDGKRYQFRVKSESSDRFSYITYFETSIIQS